MNKSKENIFINSINTNSAGTSNITKMLIKEGNFLSNEVRIVIEDNCFFSEVENSDHIDKKVFGNGFVKIAKRIKYDFFDFQKKVRKHKYNTVAIMANYSVFPLGIARKIVLMRHPYLVDKEAWNEISSKKQFFIEVLRKVMFSFTVKSTDKLVVQTDAMLELFIESYPNYKNEIQVLNNPISESILCQRENCIIPFEEREKFLFYPSRFYDHKNHFFLIDFAINCKEILVEKGIRIVVTLDLTGDGKSFLAKIKDDKLEDIFHNIGEVNQEELHFYYKKSLMLFFPSKAETFGNSIAEAMCFGLPILISDKPYARSLCVDAAVFSGFNNPDMVMKDINKILDNWDHYSVSSKNGSSKLLNSKEWFKEFIS
jgi:glycosyltransferase involved in cell wall biosynthesis